MDSLLVGSFPKSFPYSYSFTTTGGNLWRSKRCVNNYYSIPRQNNIPWRVANISTTISKYFTMKPSVLIPLVGGSLAPMVQGNKLQGGNFILRFHPKLSGIMGLTLGFSICSCASKASRHKKIQNEYNILRFWQPSLNHYWEGAEGRSTYQECNRKFVVKAAPEQSFESEHPAFDPKNILDIVKNSLDAFYRFSRPHTVIGTALSIISVSLLAVEKFSDISPLFFTGVLEAVVAALFMNIYIVGLNQLSDVEIDKINKPYLPLASGEYSFATGAIIVVSSSILSFWLAWIVGSWPLFWALFISFVLGTAYSINVPLLRWKRFAVLAAMCILSVRAVIVQLAFFLHMQTFVYKRPVVFSRPLIFATAFMSFFSVVIALFKDIPDIEGDKIFGIQSFSVRLGQKRVFWICVTLLELAYGVSLVVGATSSCLWSKIVTSLGHAVLASILFNHAKSVDLKSKASITSFYMFIWKLFYAEYFLIPLVR